MALKKSALYSSLWESANKLRGGMDGSQYKDYVLVLLFVKYVSDKAAVDPDALLEVPEGGSFADMVAAKGQGQERYWRTAGHGDKQIGGSQWLEGRAGPGGHGPDTRTCYSAGRILA